jgi:hypothetical protein
LGSLEEEGSALLAKYSSGTHNACVVSTVIAIIAAKDEMELKDMLNEGNEKARKERERKRTF